MQEVVKKLYGYIDSFLNDKIDGVAFEKAFSDIYDFEELGEQQDLEYFDKVRILLEHFSQYENDLKKHPGYYISEKQLRVEISNLNQLLR